MLRDAYLVQASLFPAKALLGHPAWYHCLTTLLLEGKLTHLLLRGPGFQGWLQALAGMGRGGEQG